MIGFCQDSAQRCGVARAVRPGRKTCRPRAALRLACLGPRQARDQEGSRGQGRICSPCAFSSVLRGTTAVRLTGVAGKGSALIKHKTVAFLPVDPTPNSATHTMDLPPRRLCECQAAKCRYPSLMRPPMAWADQYVLSRVEIVLQARKTPALSGPSIIRHRPSRRAALPVSSVEQDLDLLHVPELVNQRAPQILLFPRDDDQAEHLLRAWHSPGAADLLQHSHLRCVNLPCGGSVADGMSTERA